MKLFIRSTFIASFALALALPAAAFADNVIHKGHLNVEQPTTVADHQLAPGEYQLRWQQDGATAQVSVVEGGKTVVTTTAKVVTLKSKASGDSTDTIHDASGRTSLVEVRFSGQDLALDFGQ